MKQTNKDEWYHDSIPQYITKESEETEYDDRIWVEVAFADPAFILKNRGPDDI